MTSESLFDAIIVGAGFSGLHLLHKLRQQNFKVRLFEAGGDLGGVWYWNCYPGARVDLDHQVYQYSQPEIWKDFQWEERYPSLEKIREYFHHVDKKLNLRPAIKFNTRVTAANFNDDIKQWFVRTDRGDSVITKTLILCTGYATTTYTPPFKGLSKFKGQWFHTGSWPQDGVDLNGKSVAVIGTGASGVQIIQEISPLVSHLTVYQRTPNFAVPMQQYSGKEKDKWQEPGQTQQQILSKLRTTFFGANAELANSNAMDATPDERKAFYEELFRRGGLAFMLATFQDVLFNKEANTTAYQFWCEKTRARIHDPVKRNILAPLEPPHVLGAKRLSLEQRYYEVFNQENVDIINIKQSPIIRITESGIETEQEGLTEVDVIVFATGFDFVTGSILNIEIRNGTGETLKNKWKDGTLTYLGLATAGFPNLFLEYGPQAPTAFGNGPVSAEIQGDWITELLVKMKNEKLSTVEATKKAEQIWTSHVNNTWNSSLFCTTDNWYNGSNIPGKPREALCYLGGIPSYLKALNDSKTENYDGFVFS